MFWMHDFSSFSILHTFPPFLYSTFSKSGSGYIHYHSETVENTFFPANQMQDVFSQMKPVYFQLVHVPRRHLLVFKIS